MVSTIGTTMTQFALTIWAWQLTEAATAIALITFFFQLPQILIAIFAGLIVDRFNRKYLMMFSDVSIAISTLLILWLYNSNHLEIWHLYGLAIAYGCFGQIQKLAYNASISLIIPKQHYTRASSMSSLVNYSAAIIAPALVGMLYPAIGIGGIIAIDLATFLAGIITLLIIPIPQPIYMDSKNLINNTIRQEIAWGTNYILSKPSLRAMTISFCLFLFTYHLGETLLEPMILARTNGNPQILGTVVTAAGVGGVIGGLILSLWGDLKHKIRAMLLGFIGAGLGGIGFGLGQTPLIWISAQFFSSCHIPLSFSASYAVWYAKVEPEIQGRVLAAAHTFGLIFGTMASLIAGPLADRVFTPMMNSQGWLQSVFMPLVGTESGAGIALLYILTSIGMILVGAGSYAFPTLLNAENLLPDHQHQLTPLDESGSL